MKECEKIFGEAELDESYFGAYRKRGYHGKLQTRTRNAQTAGVWYFETQRDGVLLKLSRTARRGYFINGIENFWSCAKRRLSKFNGVKINFELHLKECEWRYRKDSALLEMKLKKIVKCYLNS